MIEDTNDRPFARRHESGLCEDEFGALGPANPGVGPLVQRVEGTVRWQSCDADTDEPEAKGWRTT